MDSYKANFMTIIVVVRNGPLRTSNIKYGKWRYQYKNTSRTQLEIQSRQIHKDFLKRENIFIEVVDMNLSSALKKPESI